MRNFKILFLLIVLSFNSCFTGADTYEKNVNDYFFLYSINYSTDNVCLGTTDDMGYRIGDNYICAIEKIGWNKSFIIVKTKEDKYYIQDLKNLKNKPADTYKNYLFGPFSKIQYNLKRNSLLIEKNLDFDIFY